MLNLTKKYFHWFLFTIKTFTLKKPLIVEILPEETVIRNKPVNFIQSDALYFNNEFKIKIGPCFEIICRKALVMKYGHIVLNNKILKQSWSGEPFLFQDLYWNFTFEKAIKTQLPCCVFTSWSDNYFHWFCDVMPKLMYLKNKGELESYVYYFSNVHNKKYITDSLDLLNVSYKFFSIDDNCLFVSKLKYISLTAEIGNYRPNLLNNIHTFFVEKVNKTGVKKKPFRRIYISRSKADKRFILNEENLIPILIENNFEIIHFEDLSLLNQIELMTETLILISIHGAGLTNMLFMPPNGFVYEFRRKNDYHNNCFFSLASIFELKYIYQICDFIDEDINVDINLFYDNIKNFL